MTPEEREAEQVSIAMQIALTSYGVKVVEDALALWQDIPVTAQATDKWLAQAVRFVVLRRKPLRALGLAYYQLVRALRTGKTVDGGDVAADQPVKLNDLRKNFVRLAGTKAAKAYKARGSDKDIEVQHIAGLTEALDKIERAAQAEAVDSLTSLGSNNLKKKVGQLDTSKPADQVDAQRAEAHRKAGARQAATAERMVLNGARSTVWTASQGDKAVLGWIRLSRTGTPCGWCAMLISRGPVYKSEKSASIAKNDDGNRVNDMDTYHDNCKCYAEPVFSIEQYNNNPLYALNREYSRLWPIVTKGLGGKDALSAWRYFIRQEQKKATAQAA